MFRKMPFILVAVILAIVFLDQFIPLLLKQFLYSLSLSIKNLIVFILPVIIFGLLFKASVNLASRATSIIALILIGVCCSNFLSTFISHYVGMSVYNFDLSIILPHDTRSLKVLWELSLPRLIANDKAMFFGLALGIILAKIKPQIATIWVNKLGIIVDKMLMLVALVIPIFVTGFVFKLQYDGVISLIIRDYTLIFGIVALAQYSYIFLAYLLLAKGRISSFIYYLKNMLPAAIAGFSTMSSAASMPLTIIGTENNLKNKDLAKSAIPATVNVHLVGDCFAIPIFAYAVLKNYGIAEPSFATYLVFSFYFILAKFSVAAIPGGGIIVMLPILENYLGFNAEMMSLITALYILFDPVITSANVLGNGAFAKLLDRILEYPFLKKELPSL